MKLFKAQEMRNADAAAASLGIDTQLLMETAGRMVAEAALRHWPEARRALVLCGKGNNGGDGYVAARYLVQAGWRVSVLEHAGSQDALSSDDSRAARSAWCALGTTEALNPENVEKGLEHTDLVIDALFGSGLSRPLEGRFADIVTLLNDSKKAVLSVDVPSGISADQASLIGPVIRTTRTLQLAGAKVASAFYPARAAFGAWEVADIGVPERVLDAQAKTLLLDDETVGSWLPTRGAEVHKYTVGTVLIVAGSKQYLGAAELACRAAYRGGAGLVTLAAEGRLPSSWPEIIFEKLNWQGQPLDQLAALADKRVQVRVIGPGLDEDAAKLVPELIRQHKVPTVLDAGALQIADAWFEAVRAHGRCVLTPHAGEAARLLDKESGAILEDPPAAARELSEKTSAIVILKGPSTVITSPDGRTAVSLRGHPGMATGGTGDALAGLVGAFLKGADNPDICFERTAAAVYLHGLAGELAASALGDSLLASDLIRHIAPAWQSLSS